jgi:UPF0271 protein
MLGSSGSLTIDLNCDMGEGMPTDDAIFPFITSANIACGGHAGDADSMRRAVDGALRHNVAVGAHPSYPDRGGFGRVDLLGGAVTENDLPQLIADQLGQLQAVCSEFGVRVHHVKPHGALYNRAARDKVVSAIICRAIIVFDPSLILYGLCGSVMGAQAKAAGLIFVNEVFADRTYRADGSLTPRTEPHALIEDPDEAVAQALSLIRAGGETICIHGDGVHAVEFANVIHQALVNHQIKISAPPF